MDIQLSYNDVLNVLDIGVSGGDLAKDDGLKTAVIISLFTDRRADDDDVIPDGTDDRRGWWGDIGAIDGDRIGSKLWLLSRSKQLTGVARQAEGYITDALAWLVDDGVARSVSAACEWVSMGVLAAAVTLTRPDGTPLTFKFANLWEALNAV